VWGEKLNTYRSLVGKPEEKRSFGRYWARGMVILEFVLRK
jgi:hypothetical protein